ncbi:hypothetical protein Pint_03862 [Pistacia integerrima]|uniref:Uncharacterized protein n=1 Tax=Pistacia integerrima TaxID=434235 RepID=A0ACC0Z9Z2_9ROSI|nr:hypothetical protein Pint_03862 [Pistacia integerrima]
MRPPRLPPPSRHSHRLLRPNPQQLLRRQVPMYRLHSPRFHPLQKFLRWLLL